VTFDLLRRDPSIQALPKWMLIAPLAASVLEGTRTMIFGWLVWRGGPVETTPPGDLLVLIFILWLPIALFLLFGRTGQRCTTFDLGMPLSARRLSNAHLLAVTLASLAVLVATAVIVRLRDGLVAVILDDAPIPPSNLLSLSMPLVATVVLAVVLLQGRDPSLQTTSARRGNARFAVTTVVALYGLVVALAWLPAAVTLVPLVVAVVLALRFRRSVPEAFAVVPREAQDVAATPDAAAGPADDWTPSRPRGSLLDRFRRNLSIVHVLSRGIGPGQLIEIPALLAFGYPFIAIWGVMISGMIFSESFWCWMLILTAYLLFAFLPAPMMQLYVFDPLPVSRRRLFACIVLPVLLLLSLGHGAGWIAGRLLDEPAPRVKFQEAVSESLVPPYPLQPAMVRVPVEHCRIAWNGRPPDNDSPWGESHPPWTIPLIRGGNAVLYSPFSTPEGSSPEFVALQISRAVETVYGRSVPPSEIMARYLEVDDGGTVVPSKAGGLTLRHDYPDLVEPRRVTSFPLYMLLTTVLYLFTSCVYLRSCRVTVSHRRRLVLFFALLGSMFALHLALTALFLTRVVRETVVSGLLKIFAKWLTEVLPGGTVGVWIVCALLFWGTYRTAESEFERIEAPLPARSPEA
jgi:hypothetical protein